MAIVVRFLAILALAVAALPARAASEADYHALNKAIVAGHVLPRQAAFADATAALQTTADVACASRAAVDLAALRAAFVAALDAWEAVQHVGFGPVEYFSRRSRIFFWPDPRNSVGRQLGDLLAKGSPQSITEQSIASESVAVQGLPALERLLYDEGLAARLAAGADGTDTACAAVRAIAANLATMARDINEAWSQGDKAYVLYLDQPGPDHPRFRHHREVTVELFKSLHAAVELVADHKLARPLGASIQAARPRLAEAWRSGRSLANIRANLAAARALYAGSAGKESMSAFVREVAGDRELDDLLTRAFAQTLATADGISGSLEAGVASADSRRRLETLSREAKALKALLAQRLAPALGVPVGFNALDGD
jgi:predicted lipoprotein